MTMRVFAVDGKTDTSQDYRLTAGGVWAPASALNARTGVTTPPTLTGTGSLTANIGPFSAVIDGTSNALQGCYCVTNDTAVGVTLTAGSAQDRIDLIGVQVQDNTWDGSGQHQAIPVYVGGTPGSGTAPATPANCIPLFNVAVPASATSVNFTTATTSVFPYTAAAGGIIPVRSAGDKPAVGNAAQYRHRLDVAATSTGPSPLESSVDGITWTPVSNINGAYGAWTNLSVASPFTVDIQPQYRTAPGGQIQLRGSFLNVSGGNISSGTTALTGLPTPSSSRFMPMANEMNAFLQVNSGSTSAFVACPVSITNLARLGLDGLAYTT